MFRFYDKSTFNTEHFDSNPFYLLMRTKGVVLGLGRVLKDFIFRSLLVTFSSGGMPSEAAKGLNTNESGH